MKRWYCIFLFICAQSLYAAIPVTGSFYLSQSCPTYLSKNKQDLGTTINLTEKGEYSLLEINRKKNPDWFRIQLPGHAQEKRWIAASCGHAHYYNWSPTKSCNNKPGLADTYVFALSWLPGFCETYGRAAGKAECLTTDTTFYGKTHLSLHGLWPNQKRCGTSYGFCGSTPLPHHCDYAPLTLGAPEAQLLQDTMPSYAFGSCLERHEWYKHGTCQLLDPDAYFAQAIQWTQKINASPLGMYLHEHTNQRVPRSMIQNKIAESFGKDAINKIFIGCHNGIFVDMWVQLPKDFTKTSTLRSLILRGNDVDKATNCPKWITIM